MGSLEKLLILQAQFLNVGPDPKTTQARLTAAIPRTV